MFFNPFVVKKKYRKVHEPYKTHGTQGKQSLFKYNQKSIDTEVTFNYQIQYVIPPKKHKEITIS